MNQFRFHRGRGLKSLPLLLGLLLLSLVPAFAQDEAELPSLVVIPGSFQSELGCSDDWQPDCEVTALTYDEGDALYSGEFTLPAGEYEYKVALDGSWDVNYGLNAEANGANIPLTLAEETTVRFIYQPSSNYVTDNVNGIIANVPGSYQDEIGCSGEWQPDCLRSLLTDVDGDGIYTYAAPSLPAGAYEAKVAYNESWALNYGEGGAEGGANIAFVVGEDGQDVVFSYDRATNIMTVSVGGQTAPAVGNLFTQRAIWVTADTIAWNIARIPGATYTLHYSPDADLTLNEAGVEGGETVALEYDRAGLPEDVLARNPQLADDYFALRLNADDLARVPEILQSQLAVSTTYNTPQGEVLGDATGVQIWGVLDDVYATDAPLGLNFTEADEATPILSVWAPTAQNVRLHLFAAADPATEPTIYDMERADNGVWSVMGEPDWYAQYYLYEVTVFAPAANALVTNLVTDPYAVELSLNSTRSRILDLSRDPAIMPEGWSDVAKPELEAFEDAVVYELQIRDFSISDESVRPEYRGTYLAFTEENSAGMEHLRGLAEAGLTHVHLLPAFDIATVNENPAERQEPDSEALAALPPDSEEQQALIEPLRDLDGFNWGYDPYHYSVPEGSYAYALDEGGQRILQFRQMVQALNEAGLRVVMDVVYNHTNAAGQGERAVLDRIVPGYYHRLSADGRVETSTCCANTATEHRMMQRLMLDSLRLWATQYKVDGFRFDLMGHHMLDNMVEVREMLDSLTLENDGVDGSQIFVYGEGWNFGEVADNARGVNATQLNLGGTGIASFNDRLRDAVRGGNPFGGWQEQGVSNGLFTLPNEVETRTPEEQRARLLEISDWVRIGLAGNLADYGFESYTGSLVTGAEISYNGQPAGYTQDPQEQIVYVSAHDNETIFDAITMKAPLTADIATRVRMHNLALDFAMLSQGIPFFHAGDDLLRSKSLDRNSYNSGDWFNLIDWTGQTNGFGRGLPPAGDNRDNWPIFQPLLANPALVPSPDDIAFAGDHFREMLQVRASTPLFRLRTGEDVMERMTFLNTGAEQTPGVIAYVLDGSDYEGGVYESVVVIFNATPDAITLEDAAGVLPGDAAYSLHPVLAESVDTTVQDAAFADGAFTVPGFTTAVFVAGGS